MEPCGDDGVLLHVTPETPLPRPDAGRFYMLRREDGLSPMIPRPFSLYRQDGAQLVFLIKVMGQGTRALAACRPGEELRLIGPLGKGWPALDSERTTVMLAGGIGSAPFYMAIQDSLAAGIAPEGLVLIYGAQTEGLLYDLETFRSLGVRVLPATDDGSHGFHGNVLACLEAEREAGRIPSDIQLLACGPEPMLAAVERHARAAGMPALLSLETLMGCGVGICNGCVVPTREDGPLGAWPNAKCCVEGPIFSTEEILVR